MSEYVIRFLAGGIIVSVFAMLGDLLRPKSFAGLFSAAPSVALASLGIVVATKGSDFAAIQARSMILGAIALLLYSVLVCQLQVRWLIRALPATLISLPLWLAISFGLHFWLIGDG